MPSGGELTAEDKGRQAALERGCLSCHSVDGSQSIGPTWLGLAGSERQLEDGSNVVADEAYLRTSILEPESQIVAGYPGVMPNAYDFLAEEDVTAIIEYIRSLGQ